jgi:hypothetical protein
LECKQFRAFPNPSKNAQTVNRGKKCHEACGGECHSPAETNFLGFPARHIAMLHEKLSFKWFHKMLSPRMPVDSHERNSLYFVSPSFHYSFGTKMTHQKHKTMEVAMIDRRTTM